MLHNTGKYELTSPGKMNLKEVRSMAKVDFEMWFVQLSKRRWSI